jgi:hypothetical protein
MTSSSESFNILQLIANDCYRVPYALTYIHLCIYASIFIHIHPVRIRYLLSDTTMVHCGFLAVLSNLNMIVYNTLSHMHCMI